MKKQTLNILLIITAVLIWLLILNLIRTPGVVSSSAMDVSHQVRHPEFHDSADAQLNSGPLRNPFLYVNTPNTPEKKDTVHQKNVLKNEDQAIINIELLGVIADTASCLAVVKYKDSVITFVHERDTLFEYTVVQIDTDQMLLGSNNEKICIRRRH